MSAVSDKSSEGYKHLWLLRCINCAREMPLLYVQYLPGNIRLMQCEYCRAIADPYIECEFMIILIDLILHKRKAYRHLLFNILNLGGNDKVLLNVILGNLIFMSVLFLGTRLLLKLSFNTASYRQILLAVLISTYFRLYLIAMLVWEFPSSVLYIIGLLVLSSNALALGVVTESQTAGCLIVCFGAHVAKFFSNHWLLHLLSGSSQISLRL